MVLFLLYDGGDKGVLTFPKGICQKVNVTERLDFELAYYESAVHHFNHYVARTPQWIYKRLK